MAASLFKKYRKARDYAAAEPAVLDEEIRSTGFDKNKTRSVIACCHKLVADFHGEPHTLEALTALPEVGRKTANMVLGNAFGVPAIAVDTARWLVHSDDSEKVEAALMRQVAKDKWTVSATPWSCKEARPALRASRAAPNT